MIDRTLLRIARALLATALLVAAMMVLLPENPIYAVERPQIQAGVAPSVP